MPSELCSTARKRDFCKNPEHFPLKLNPRKKSIELDTTQGSLWVGAGAAGCGEGTPGDVSAGWWLPLSPQLSSAALGHGTGMWRARTCRSWHSQAVYPGSGLPELIKPHPGERREEQERVSRIQLWVGVMVLPRQRREEMGFLGSCLSSWHFFGGRFLETGVAQRGELWQCCVTAIKV